MRGLAGQNYLNFTEAGFSFSFSFNFGYRALKKVTTLSRILYNCC